MGLLTCFGKTCRWSLESVLPSLWWHLQNAIWLSDSMTRTHCAVPSTTSSGSRFNCIFFQMSVSVSHRSVPCKYPILILIVLVFKFLILDGFFVYCHPSYRTLTFKYITFLTQNLSLLPGADNPKRRLLVKLYKSE